MASRLANPLTIPDEEDFDLFAVMSALTDPTRRALVEFIAADPGTSCSTSDFGVTKSALTRHWRVLREAGIIRQEAQGNRHSNWVRREELDRRFPGLLDMVLQAGAPGCATPASETGGADRP
ncbi:ArsR family transcriptional regulator [Glaciihabitans tibetensis]|uniref:ArsR family transcriptional regulator n=1 Tax=Glaciihabitans tibetensis TaxID=1266600 RepID=A0A2T0VFH1_9MICO|nr:helix-turn-helix domain-containing protein [Glaciihabitans tibetensis]PRY68958.1 ArsR family transcriptional regulator [Glaciihabitans tibetensis]